MLRVTALQIFTACNRAPFDWIAGDDLVCFRQHESTERVNTLQVRRAGIMIDGGRILDHPLSDCPMRPALLSVV